MRTFRLDRLGMYRRLMIGAIRDSRMQALAIVFAALEEALLRSSLVVRDTFFAEFFGQRELTAVELAHQRKVWAVSSAMGMCTSVVQASELPATRDSRTQLDRHRARLYHHVQGHVYGFSPAPFCRQLWV